MDKVLGKLVTEYLIDENNSSQNNKKIVKIVNENEVQSNLLKLIQVMGEYLTHEDSNIRSKAIALLSNVISDCEQEKINTQAVSVLVNFYCSRLSDQTCVSNLMTGLVALTQKYDNFSLKCAEVVIKSLDNDVHVQSFPHITRNAAFQIYESLLDNHLEDVKPSTNIYLSGFIRSMVGEKDPRNLMTVYTIVQKIVKSLDISNHVENIFDATFCYFPITFRPPADNPYGITAKDLKLNLRKCMASTPLFSKYAMPLLLRKLSTTSGTAKKDAIETLSACVKIYPTNELLTLGVKLYETMKVEILNSDPDPGLREPSLDAIHSLTKALTLSEKTTEVAAVIRPIIDNCTALLDELEESSIKPASLILRSIASASSFVYSLVECVVLPKLLRQYREHDEMADRYLILCTMVAIIQARKIVFGPIVTEQKNSDVDVNHDSTLVSYKDRLIEIFSSSIKKSNDHPEVRLMGILGLGLLCVLNNYMTKNERKSSAETLSRVLKTEEDERLRNSVEISLIEISTFDSSLVSDVTVSILIDTLPDFSSLKDEGLSYKLTLSTIKKLCTKPDIYERTEHQLLTKFIYVCSHNEDRNYALEIITTLLQLIQSKIDQKHTDLKKCVKNLLHKLITSVVSTVLDESFEKNKVIILNEEVVQNINLIILAVFSQLDALEQADFASEISKYFKDKDLSGLGLKATPNFDPLLSGAPAEQAACTQIYATVMSAFRKDAKMPIESTSSFLEEVLAQALKSNCQAQVVAFSRIIASLINKWKKDEDFNIYLQSLKDKLIQLIESKSVSALNVYIWVTKALVICNHAKGLEMVDTIINWIPDSAIGKVSSNGFGVLIGEDPLCLNKQCYANITFLYKQKLMAYSLPKLLERHSKSNEDEKLNYLIAISYVLKNVAKSALITQLPQFVPLLIESISYPETDLQLSTIELFQFIINETTEIIKPHMEAFLPALTSLISNQKSMHVRLSALKCLELVSIKISRDILLPYTMSTIKSLAIPLDDKKRLVRKQAVECREKWYLVCQK